ncbi:putative ribonuclease H-like domain-containing protein [Tanacetum coccineum]
MNESEVVNNVFNSKESDVDDSLVDDRFKIGKGFHAVPPPYTGNYMPLRTDLSFAGLDYSVYKAKVSEIITIASKTSKDSLEKPKIVRPSAPIIKDWDIDSDNDSVFRPKLIRQPKFTKIYFVNLMECDYLLIRKNSHRQEEYILEKSKSRDNMKTTGMNDDSETRELRRAFNQKSAAKTNNLNEKVKTARVNNVTTAVPKAVVSAAVGNGENAIKSSACWIWRTKQGNDQGIFDSGCSRNMTRNKSFLIDYQEVDGGFVTFIRSPKGGKITRKGKIRTGKLDFKDTECLVLSPDFKLLDESQVLLKVPRQNNMYSFDLKNVVPSGGLTCLFAKATIDESNLWHRRLGHINFKTMNKLVRGNLVRGLPLKLFENDHTCVCCLSGDGIAAQSFLTPQQNRVAERKNRTLIEAARTMLADSLLPTTFWAEAVSTACYVQNKIPRKFDEKAVRGSLLDYSINRNGPNWLFDIDALTISMNYKPVVAGNQTNGNAGTKENIDAGQDGKKMVPDQKYILLPLLTSNPSLSKSSKDSPDATFKPSGDEEKIDSEHQENEDSEVLNTEDTRVNQEQDANVNNINNINTISLTIVYSDDDEEVGAEANMNNLATNVPVSPIQTTIVHKDHLLEQIIGDIHSAPQTRRMTKNVIEHEAMQDELLQFKLQKVWTLVDLPHSKRAIGTKWVYINKKDDRGIMVRNKARLMAQGYTQEEGIDYDEVFAPVTRIEAIRLFLAYASFMGFIVYQMDVKSAFLYGTIEEEVYVCQPPGFEDPQFPDKVYKVEKALYGLHQAPRAWYETLSTYLLENGFRRGTIDKTLFIKKDKGDILLVQVYVDDIIFGSTKKSLCVEFEQMMHKRFQMSSMGELTFFLGLQVKQKDDGIFISQDKYVADILKKFDFATVKTASTPIETNKALLKDEEAEDVDVHLYRSMIGSLMYLTASRPDIMFVVCACARFQVTPKVSHLHAVKRIFRYLKGQPKLGLWYPRDSPFDLEAFSDSDYAGASLDRKSTTGGCQFLGKRLISWQCKKQTIVANSTTKAEYVAAANFYESVYKEWEDRMERAATTASSLVAEQDSVNAVTLNLLLPVLVYAARHTLPAIRHKFMLTGITYYCWFWAFAKAKIVNGERQIQALVDKKKVIITETSIRSDLKLDDAERIDCVPTALIFTELERMSTMESAIICLATNQTFNFSKYIFDNMVKHLEGGVKFLMYPRFVQVFLDKQVKGMNRHKEVYVTPSHTKKVFANMKRPGKGFLGRIKPIFPTMMIQASEDMEPVTDEARVSTPSYNLPQSGKDSMQLSELMNLCTSLQEKVLDLEKAKTAQAKEIASLKKRVKQLEKRRKLRTLGF